MLLCGGVAPFRTVATFLHGAGLLGHVGVFTPQRRTVTRLLDVTPSNSKVKICSSTEDSAATTNSSSSPTGWAGLLMKASRRTATPWRQWGGHSKASRCLLLSLTGQQQGGEDGPPSYERWLCCALGSDDGDPLHTLTSSGGQGLLRGRKAPRLENNGETPDTPTPFRQGRQLLGNSLRWGLPIQQQRFTAWRCRDDPPGGNGNAAAGRYGLLGSFRTPARQTSRRKQAATRRPRDQIPAVERDGSRLPESGRKVTPFFPLFLKLHRWLSQTVINSSGIPRWQSVLLGKGTGFSSMAAAA